MSDDNRFVMDEDDIEMLDDAVVTNSLTAEQKAQNAKREEALSKINYQDDLGGDE